MTVSRTSPEDTIHQFLQDHGGETDATVGHLLSTFGVDGNDPAGRDRITNALGRADVQLDRPLSSLRADDGIRLSIASQYGPDTAAGVNGAAAGDEPLDVDEEVGQLSVKERRAGWYQDPTSRDHLRWWDGSAWTADARPVPAPDPLHYGPPVPPAGGAKTSWYKRWWFSGLVVLLVAGIGAGIAILALTSHHAAKGPSVEPSRATHPGGTPHAPPTTATIGDSLTLKGSDTTLRARVTGVVDPLSGGEFDSPSSGKRYVGVDVALRNVGSQVYSDAVSNGSTLILKGNEQADTTILSGGQCSSNFGSDLKLAPGDTRAGCIPFEVPSNARLRTFQFTLDSGFANDTGEWALPSGPVQSSGTSPSAPSAPAAPAPESFTACDGNIMAKVGSTTCQFAENAFYEYWTNGQPSSISVYSPATGSTYDMTCDTTTGDVRCDTDGGAAVKFSQASVDGYSQDQADNYAATHQIGPGG